MALNADQIRSRQLVENMNDNQLRPSSYDLTIGTIIDSHGNEQTDFTLDPQEMVIAISANRLKLPKNVVGYALPRITLNNRGILSLSTGIVDPGYEGLVSSTLINFGKEPYPLRAGTEFLRVAFHEIEDLEDDAPIRKITGTYNISDSKYKADRRKIAKTLPETFLDIPTRAAQIATDIAEKVAKARFERVGELIGRGATTLAVITLIVAIVAFLAAPIASELTTNSVSDRASARIARDKIDPVEDDISKLRDRVNKLEEKQFGGSGQSETQSK